MAHENLHLKVEVEIDGAGKKLDTISHLSIVQRIDWHHTFEIRASLESVEGDRKYTIDKSKDFVGKGIKIGLKAQQGSSQLNFFKGVITEVSLSRYGGAAADLLIRGFSPSILLDDGPHCASHLEKPLSQIVDATTQGYPVNLLAMKSSPSPDTMMPFAVQYNESAYNFLGRLANSHGQWFYYNGSEMIFGKPDGKSKADLFFGHDLSNFELSVKVSPLKFEAHTYDYVKNEQLKQASSNAVPGVDTWASHAVKSSDSLYNSSHTYHSPEVIKDQGMLKAVTESRKNALAASLVVFTGVSDNPVLNAGTRITVKGAATASIGGDKLDYGQYIITSVAHQTDGLGSYQNRFEAIPADLKVSPLNANIKETLDENQVAKVVDNKDPDALGRIKVQYYWQKSADTTPWLRMTTPHAGKERGFYMLPEIGDEVIVGFEHGNASIPFVIGSLYNGKENSSDRYDNDNYIKTIRTISGNEIRLSDKSGEEAIHIFTKDKMNEVLITMKDDGLVKILSNKNIMVEAKDGIEVKSKTMKFTAEESIEFKAKEFKVGTDTLIQLDSMKDLKSKGLNVTTEATSALKMSSNATAEFTANATMEISGNAKTTVKATGQLELSAAAQATLKAGIVMIN
ncbi:MAG: type VI secretion system tip protein VgrG [Flavobacteriales bacterium]|nr:type VI secretion system tip protein VgrG [Flavobacteriales bacterium]